jgi:site-specific DNA-methyltransferase (adenine-specific)
VKPYYEHAGITIYHGDCRVIANTLGADLVLTDPPYGVGATYGQAYDDARDTYWEWFVPAVKQLRGCAPVMAMTHRVTALKWLTDWDWCGVWHKPYGAGCRVGNSPVLPHWEPILLWGIHSLGPSRDALADVISINPERRGAGDGGSVGRERLAMESAAHPFPKPVALFSRLVKLLSHDDTCVLDPFMGSGTTLVAAKNLGRRAIGIEIEERYCEIAAKRLAQEVMDFGEVKP